jgi:hypothetical protein
MTDIISEYAFARNHDQLSSLDMPTAFGQIDRRGARIRQLVKHMPWILAIIQVLPTGLLSRLNPGLVELNKRCEVRTKAFRVTSVTVGLTAWFQDIYQQVSELYAQRKEIGENTVLKATIFHDIMRSDLPECEKVPNRLYQDGKAVIFGALTTATPLSEITFHLLRNPEALKRLREEIMSVMPEPETFPPLATIQKLPFMAAVVKEGLRLNNGVGLRLPRIPTQETLEYVARLPGKGGKVEQKKYSIPPGTTVMMTPLLIHHSSTYFDEPHTFRPQRWIDNPYLEKRFMPFSRGSRQCIAMNLALAEIYLTMTAVFRRYGSRETRLPGDLGYLEIFGTTSEDMEIMGEGMIPFHRNKRRLWIRVRDS